MPTPIDYANTVLTGLLTKPVGDPRDYTKEYGGIPTLPPYTQDVTTVLGEDTQAEMIKNLPNYQAMLQGDVENIMSNIAGQVPADVLTQLQQRGAERGISMGGAGSPAANAAYLRALGLTSLQLQQLGNEQLTKAMARTPIQKSTTTVTTKDLSEDIAKLKGAPDPKAAAEQALKNAIAGILAGKGGVIPPAPSGGGLTYGTGGAQKGPDKGGLDDAYAWQDRYFRGLNIYGGAGRDPNLYKDLVWDPEKGTYEPTKPYWDPSTGMYVAKDPTKPAEGPGTAPGEDQAYDEWLSYFDTGE